MGSFSDRLDHSTILFRHLDLMSREVAELFKKEFKDGNISGALPSTKIQNWRALVQWYETIMVQYLKKQYYDRREIIQANYAKAWKEKDLDRCFDLMIEQAQILMLEANNQGFMMKQTISGDYIIDERKDKKAEE